MADCLITLRSLFHNENTKSINNFLLAMPQGQAQVLLQQVAGTSEEVMLQEDLHQLLENRDVAFEGYESGLEKTVHNTWGAFFLNVITRD